MLRCCTRDEIEKYTEFAYELALDLTRSGYPTYKDGIKTKEDFSQGLIESFEAENEEVLLFEYNGRVEGMISYFWIPEDKYIETHVFNINQNTEQALKEFMEYVGEKHKGFEMYMGFPAENTKAVRFLTEQGLECVENDYNNTVYLDRIDLIPDSSDLLRITKDNFEKFKVLHDRIEGDMYWNSERIWDTLDDWTVLVSERGGITKGAVYYRNNSDDWVEIYGLDHADERVDTGTFKALLLGAMHEAQGNGISKMTFFCDKEEEKATIECGFTCISEYFCFKKNI